MPTGSSAVLNNLFVASSVAELIVNQVSDMKNAESQNYSGYQISPNLFNNWNNLLDSNS